MMLIQHDGRLRWRYLYTPPRPVAQQDMTSALLKCEAMSIKARSHRVQCRAMDQSQHSDPDECCNSKVRPKEMPHHDASNKGKWLLAR